MLPVACLRVLTLLTAGLSTAMASSVSAPTWVVGQCHADPTDEIQFVRQVAHEASRWTDENGFEVCGRLAQSPDGRWGLTLTTNYSQLACLAADGLAPQGYTVVGEKFHTHPKADAQGVIELHPYTVQLATDMGSTDLDGLSHIHLSNAAGFSRQDVAMGGGYLAAEGRLLLHKRGQTQDLGVITPAPPTCQFSR